MLRRLETVNSRLYWTEHLVCLLHQLRYRRLITGAIQSLRPVIEAGTPGGRDRAQQQCGVVLDEHVGARS